MKFTIIAHPAHKFQKELLRIEAVKLKKIAIEDEVNYHFDKSVNIKEFFVENQTEFDRRLNKMLRPDFTRRLE